MIAPVAMLFMGAGRCACGGSMRMEIVRLTDDGMERPGAFDITPTEAQAAHHREVARAQLQRRGAR